MAQRSYDDQRLTSLALLLETAAGLHGALAPRLAESGLSETSFAVLLHLAREADGRMRMTDLAGHTAVSTSGVTRVVDRLESEGLVERVLCQEDRRGLWARLTDEGRSRLDAVLPDYLDLVEQWFTSRLGESQLEALDEALRAVRDGGEAAAEVRGSCADAVA
jgi:MarR family 2-MHQ and catechol resistance regulon transcriptional repressor